MLCASHLFLMHCMPFSGASHGGAALPCRSQVTREERNNLPGSLQVILKGRIKKLATKMVITSGNEEDKGSQEKESKEETILAMLGIIGTILNLIVIIFVYIYTTL
ncbi:protein TUNAR isoform X1 [Phalacrocorax carbo]|uniref:protein TUNAR isoform X1 n=1 Tax=Phalacrocorax carbo TaxID=9209 RepID=UPI00311A2631